MIIGHFGRFSNSRRPVRRHLYNQPMRPRFHVPSILAPGASVDLPPEAAHHADRVLRMKPGYELCGVDGRGGEWTARVVRMKPTVHVALEVFDSVSRVPDLQLTLVQGLPAADKMDWILQKAVELGVSAIHPVIAKRSVVRLSGDKLQRRQVHWHNVAVAACEQCGANIVPVIAPLLDLPQFMAQPVAQNEKRWIMLPGTGSRLREMSKPSGQVTILVGPEGGFEEGEVEIALLSGFEPLGFGPRVLRTETAGLAVLAALTSLWGDC